LSDVLRLVSAQGYMAGVLDFGGAWSYAFATDGAFRCFAVAAGACWLSVHDSSPPMRIGQGEFFALPHGQRFTLASDPALPARDIYQELDGPLRGRVLQLGGGGDCCLFGALFAVRQGFAGHLLDLLPAVIRIEDNEDRAALRGYLDRMMAVMRDLRPGGALVGESLSVTIMIEVLRLHLSRVADDRVGWLFALSDRRISRAVIAMHDEPARRWTVRDLAEIAGMSRSAFAVRFKAKVGRGAIEYLGRWRMLLAADRLITSADQVSVIAARLGYASESAFVFAFRREMGCTPRQYDRQTAER
jgi:AraC-like DNA-binding protein